MQRFEEVAVPKHQVEQGLQMEQEMEQQQEAEEVQVRGRGLAEEQVLGWMTLALLLVMTYRTRLTERTLCRLMATFLCVR